MTQKLDALEEDLQTLYQASLVDLKNARIFDLTKQKEGKRLNLLKAEKDSWQQKKWVVWLKCGDRNTKYFHHYASNRKNRKRIWELHSEAGLKLSGQKDLKEEAIIFFKHLGTTKDIINEDQNTIANLYP